jgi:hypothetical protein
MPAILCLLLAAAAALLCPALAQPPACHAATPLNASTPLFSTAPYFTSWNIDASRDRRFFSVDFSSPQLVYLASQLANAHIRFGGTGNDYLYYALPPPPRPSPAARPTPQSA